jgi:tetratricopeptide (TPR) repeat protein
LSCPVRSRPALAALLAVPVLAMCGCGGTPTDAVPPVDTRIEQASSAGAQALSLDQPAEAARQYRRALAHAYERDDADAIADLGFNLAVAQLRAGAVEEALSTVRRTRAELERRRRPVLPELMLVEAAAAWRLGAADRAYAAAQEVLSASPVAPDTAARAWFIQGLVFAQRGDTVGLGRAQAALRSSLQPDLEADRLELQGHAARLAGSHELAARAFEDAADKRRIALDYRGMSRVLGHAGEATLSAGRAAGSAILFLRAGRSALLHGDVTTGRALLERASGLARQAGATAVVDEVARVLVEHERTARARTATRQGGS